MLALRHSTAQVLRRVAQRTSAAAVPSMAVAAPAPRAPVATSMAVSRRHFGQAASAKDEEELVRVLNTKPRHVARRVRQLMLGSRRRVTQFRNTVTYLMIVVQSKLQKGEMSPADATVVIEGVMEECVALRQSDMAHLLFRAALRFRRYDMRISVPCLRHLFDAYRGSDASELMAQLADEMQSEPALRPLVMAAYIYARQPEKAAALKGEIPRDSIGTDDYEALVEGHGKFENWDAVSEAFDEAIGSSRDDLDLDRVSSAAVLATERNGALQENLFKAARQNGVALSDVAIASICRNRLRLCDTYEKVSAVDEKLREQLKVERLPLAAATVVVMRASEALSKSYAQGDDAMLVKVRQLRDVIETQIANDEIECIEPAYVLSLLRGFGVLGKTAEMQKCFEMLRDRTPVVDHRTYAELLRWHAQAGNVRLVLDVKREMEERDVLHTGPVYMSLFKALDRYYPKLTMQYYAEARQTLVQFDSPMYNQLLRVFTDLGARDKVVELFEEMQHQADRGVPVFNDFAVATLLRAVKGDAKEFDAVVQLATKENRLGHGLVQSRIIDGYAAQRRTEELDRFVASLPSRPPVVYTALLRSYALLRREDLFQATLEEMKLNGVPVTDAVFGTIVNQCSRWRDADKFKRIVDEVQAMVTVKSCRFYALVAAANVKSGNAQEVDKVWFDLRDSGKPIQMDTFNRFLELFVARNSIDMTQDVLRVMMERVPPNPVTTTTVVDMLGKMGRLNEMEVLLEEMSKSAEVQPTLFTYHHAMSAYAKSGDVAKIEALRERLRADGLEENNVTFNILLDGYGRAKRFEHIPELMQERAAKGIAMDDFAFSVLLGLYSKARMTAEVTATVTALLDRPAQASVAGAEPTSRLTPRLLAAVAEAFSYTHDLVNVERYVQLLLAHPDCQQTHIETVFLLYHRLRDTAKMDALLSRYGGNEFIYNICVSAFAKTQHYDRVSSLLDAMEAEGMALHTNTAIVLSALLLKAGKVELAQAVLKWKKRVATLGRRASPPRMSDAAQPVAHEGETLDADDAVKLAAEVPETAAVGTATTINMADERRM